MKKRWGIFILISVLFIFILLNFISAVWWNPFSWFEKTLQSQPPITCADKGLDECDPLSSYPHCVKNSFSNSNCLSGVVLISCTPCGSDPMDVNCECKFELGYDCDGDGFLADIDGKPLDTSNHYISSCRFLPDCDDEDPQIFPGSNVCNDCQKCGSDGKLIFDVSCNLPNDGDCKFCNSITEKFEQDNLDEFALFPLCKECVDMTPTYNPLMNPPDNGDCKKCDTSGIVPDDSDINVGECYECISGTRTYNPSFNLPNNGADCKKCTTSGIKEDLTDNSLPVPECQKCVETSTGPGVLELDTDPVANDCWECIAGLKILKRDFDLNDGDCKTCDRNSKTIVPDDSDLDVGDCKKCVSGTPTNDDTLDLPNNGNCKKCSGGSLVPDLTDTGLPDPDCQKCVETLNGPGIFELDVDPITEDCWTCSFGAKTFSQDFPTGDGDCRTCDSATFSIVNDNSDKPLSYLFSSFSWLQGAPKECVNCVSQQPNFDETLNQANDGDCKKCDAASLMILQDNQDTSLIGTCKDCELGNAVDIADGKECNSVLNSMCCGNSCRRFSSQSEFERTVCCGGHTYTLHRLIDKRRFECCDGNFKYLASDDSCGSCDRKCEGSTPYCLMSRGIFEDCFKCVECRIDGDCPPGKSCLSGSNKCFSLWPPAIWGIFTSSIRAATPEEATEILKSRLGHSSNVICPGGGNEQIIVTILSITPNILGMPFGTSQVFQITYSVAVTIINSGGVEN